MELTQRLFDDLKFSFRKNSYFSFSFWYGIELAFISVIGSLPDPETPTNFTDSQKSQLVVLSHIVCVSGRTVLPDVGGNPIPIVLADNFDNLATATGADMLALVFQ